MFRSNHPAKPPLRYADSHDITAYLWRNRVALWLILTALSGLAYLCLFHVADSRNSPRSEKDIIADNVYRYAMMDIIQDEKITHHLGESPLDADIKLDWSLVNQSLPIKAALVAVVRNGDLHNIRATIRSVEDRWNHRYNYPWVFLSEQPLSDNFKRYTQILSAAPIFFGLIDRREWSYPHWIDSRAAEQEMDRMAEMGLFRGGSLDFRLRSRQTRGNRYNAGFIQYHPLLKDLEYYWRVEPESDYLCDMPFDPFVIMKKKKKKFAFVVNDGENLETMPSLWSATRDFISNNWDKVITYNESIQPLLTNEGWQSYNGCLFWNNFAIFSMDYLRSDYYRQFFEHLDKNGGFFYERWSDTLVQTIAASLFLRREELHFFNEIGFEYNSIAHCPLQPQYRKQCVCSPTLSTDSHSCTRYYFTLTNSTALRKDANNLFYQRKRREREAQKVDAVEEPNDLVHDETRPHEILGNSVEIL